MQGKRSEWQVSRGQIIETLKQGLEQESSILAAWLGGSDASGRTDALSDIDLQIVVDDTRVEETHRLVHSILERLAPIELRHRFPDPTWHGHTQELIRLRDADPNHFLDLVVMKRSDGDRFLERERHGEPVVLLDRADLAEPPAMDWTAHRARMEQRLADLRILFPLMQPLVSRGVLRGHVAESAHGYQAHTIKPLIELLRMRHCPERFDYGPRYLDRDLPEIWRREIERLAFPGTPDALATMQAEAIAHFDGELEALDRGEWGLPDPEHRTSESTA